MIPVFVQLAGDAKVAVAAFERMTMPIRAVMRAATFAGAEIAMRRPLLRRLRPAWRLYRAAARRDDEQYLDLAFCVLFGRHVEVPELDVCRRCGSTRAARLACRTV